MKKGLIYFGILLILGAGFMYYYTQRDSRNDIIHRKADVEVSAIELLESFGQDENAAEERFLGKTVSVSGIIQSLENSPGKTTITLESGDPISAVVCEMNNMLQADFSSLEEGQQLTIKGECSGKLMDVILVNCVIEN